MANLVETPTFDAGVYQLEVTDPVQGGAAGLSNTPLKNLANRTLYLKQHVDSLEALIPTLATFASPAFTGTPTAPTPASGDSSTSIATTAFVQALANGVLTKSVAGGSNVVLSATEAGNGIYILTGALTANISVIVPSSGKSVIVDNRTTGAFVLTVKTAAGTGTTVAQGKKRELFCDGTNVYESTSDLTDVALLGTPTTSTANRLDASTRVANTDFVTREVGSMAGAVLHFARNTAPQGWLKANGAAISRATYADLFAAIGTTWGAGDGTTTFNLPDLRGEFIRGWDDGRGVDTSRVFASAQTGQNASHTHGVTDPTHAHGLYDPTHSHTGYTDAQGHHAHTLAGNGWTGGKNNFAGSPGDTDVGSAVGQTTDGAGNHAHNVQTYAAGTGMAVTAGATGISIQAQGGTEVRVRNVALLACIKY